MRDPLLAIAKRIRPSLEYMGEQERIVAAGNVIAVLYSAPLALIGFFWLIRLTDLDLIRREWLMLLALGALMQVFSYLSFFMNFEVRPGQFASSASSLDGTMMWAALLLFGPTSLWLTLFGSLYEYLNSLRRSHDPNQRWNILRVFSLNTSVTIFGLLVTWVVYQSLGGKLPLQGLMLVDIIPTLGAITVHFLISMILFGGYLIYTILSQASLTDRFTPRPLLRFFIIALMLPYLAFPFGIMAAGLYSQNGPPAFIIFVVGLLMVAWLARRLSQETERSRQRSRQLEALEQLSLDIISGPPDASLLHEALADHVPAMFPSARVIVWAEPDEFLLRHPPEWTPTVEPFWEWVRPQTEVLAFMADQDLPWREVNESHNPLIIAPILSVLNNDCIGWVYLQLQTLAQPWDEKSLRLLFPAASALAVLIANTLNQADIYAETLEHEQAVQELKLAGEIQAGFFPDEIPVHPGWEFAVTLLPARETSGDFFDFIPLEDGRLGILIADVTDKGVGPALFMALSRTLIRTYAIEYEADPDVVFFATNERILKDTRSNLFVTAFFGILDKDTGLLTYSNAGHNPPYLLCCDEESGLKELGSTGMPIGVDEDAVWEKETIQIAPGDRLVLYTDGIPDALNGQGEFFADQKLIEVTRAATDLSAYEIQTAIINEVQNFVGQAPQFDDITLIVLARDNSTG